MGLKPVDFWRLPLLSGLQVARVLLIWITGMLLMGAGFAVAMFVWPQPESSDRAGLSPSLIFVVYVVVVAMVSAAVTVAVGRAIRRLLEPSGLG